MNVNFEFLGEEPLDNVITCLDYRFDKVVFFGYQEQMQRQKETTVNFLKENCNVQEVAFRPVSHNNLDAIMEVMRGAIEQEIGRGNEIYFDITGGESLILVAFGALSVEYDTPMHVYDIPENRLREYASGSERKMSENVPRQEVTLNISQHIKLRGGVTNYFLHKEIKGIRTPEFDQDVTEIWHVAQKHVKYWNSFSMFLRNHLVPDEHLEARKSAIEICNALHESNNQLKSPRKLNEILDDLKEAGVLTTVEHTDGRYRVAFKNQAIKDCLWDGGSILELHTFQMLRRDAQDSEIGLHLDWDGVIHPGTKEDVENEIDVITLKNHILTFVSCKSGATDKKDLYELETVTRRFGGKYAKMAFVTMQPVSEVDQLRADEMGIQILKVMEEDED